MIIGQCDCAKALSRKNPSLSWAITVVVHERSC
jgi:hypothetical protein